jgi:L-threonylcarbamoyladenylate synthase
VISSSAPGAIPLALKVLRSGGIVAFPTDTVYGIAAMIDNFQAIDRLYTIKGREPRKAIAVLIGDLSQLALVSGKLDKITSRLTEVFWPGALTIVVPRLPTLPENLSHLPTIGIRMPNHPFTLELLKQSGPLATTSANLSGQPNSENADDVAKQLAGRVHLIIDGGNTPGPIASTVVDCTGPQLKIIREGVIPRAAIDQAIKDMD